MSKDKLEIIKHMAEFGRSGVCKKLDLPFNRMEAFLSYITEMRGKAFLSVADEFFCLVAGLREGGSLWRNDPHLVQQLCQSAAHMAALIEFDHEAIGKKDQNVFVERCDEIRWLLERKGFKEEKARARKELSQRAEEQKKIRAKLELLEKRKQEILLKRRQFIEKHNRDPRRTHCFNCLRDLDEIIDPIHIPCGWIKCVCNACGCNYRWFFAPKFNNVT